MSVLARRDTMSAALGVGAEAFTIVTKQVGRGERREVVDVARVRVVEQHVDGKFNVSRVVVVSSQRVVIGRELDVARGELYACTDAAEVEAFRSVVSIIWAPRSR